MLCIKDEKNDGSSLKMITIHFIAGLLKHYNPSHPDYHSTSMALVKMQSIIGKMSVKLRETVSGKLPNFKAHLINDY